MMQKMIVGTFAASALLIGGTVNATPYVVNTALSNITSSFDNVITGTGAGVSTAKVVEGVNSYSYIDKDGNNATVNVTRPNGSSPSMSSGYSDNGISLSGAVWDISPASASGDAIPGFNSGLTFTFSSPVNAFGFEIGDWATCCTNGDRPAGIQSTYGVPATGSGLWIAFDGGAATLPANALSSNDNPGVVAANSYTNFIGAIDSSSFFSTITFFGDGFGEFLVAGGTLRFASVPAGSVGGDPTGVPEPVSLALMGIGMLGMFSASRRKLSK